MRTAFMWACTAFSAAVTYVGIVNFVLDDTVEPPRRIAVWKSHDLPFEAKRAVRSWPGEPFVVTDSMRRAGKAEPMHRIFSRRHYEHCAR